MLSIDRERLSDEFWRSHRDGRLPFDVVVHGWSSLVFRASTWQEKFDPGSPVRLQATLSEYDVVVGDDRSRLWAEVLRPDGFTDLVELAFGGTDWGADYSLDAGVGLYRLRIRSSGQTFAGTTFTREHTATAHVSTGYERPGKDEDPEETTPGEPASWRELTDSMKAGLYAALWGMPRRMRVDLRRVARNLQQKG